ncbi:MAG: DUF4124 domain-containing protein [Gammaproteobacteria bacterium]|nr:DUF4124 domain-containing protein [Gammaproteobacteria bacterium]
MKSTIISMFIVLIVMITLPMYLLNDDDFVQKLGRIWGNGDGVTTDAQANGPKNVKMVVTDKKVEVYKWPDEHGVIQFSNVPPEGLDSELLVLSPETNVMDAIKIPEKEPELIGMPKVTSLGSPYSPAGMKKLVDESIEMQETLNQRQADQEKMIQDIFK